MKLGVIIYIQKDNSTYFTANELKHLRITANGMVASDHSEIDENGNHYRILSPLDDTYEIVDETIPVIKYTVILKRK